jgi:sugar O-acyltransferase (sialic acid O-acetyltransferase NeuD family)
MTALWILGAGGHGVVVADAAEASGAWTSIAFFDERWPGVAASLQWPVLGDTAALHGHLARGAGDAAVVVAVGDNTRRLELTRALAQAGAALATVIHPSAAISRHAILGAGSVVFAGAAINPRARLGLAAVVNTRASVDHDCTIGDGVHLCPGVTLAGNVTVRDRAWVGIGSCVIQGVTVGEDSIVGAGSAVTRDVRPSATVGGCPAKEIKRAV